MIYHFKKYLLSILFILFLAGCGSSSNTTNTTPLGPITPPAGGSSFDEREKSYLYDLFLTEYFWYFEVPQPFDYSPYTDPQTMINDLKYSALDRWSFVLTREQYDDSSAQRTSGFGFGFNHDLIVDLVRLGSPAEAAGLLRGDRIVTVNGEPASPDLIMQASNSLDQVTHFTVDRFGTTLNIDITAQYYSYRVVDSKIVQTDEGERVGYLRLDLFSEIATDEMETAFTNFSINGIDKLVIDLRYNPGGLLNTASILMDKIGRDYNGRVQCTLEWNDKNSNENETLYFDSLDPNSLSLKKLVFLTTGESASASELVINSMEPYMHDNVAIVGTRTHGKPVGMSGRTDGSYIYFIINFILKNSDGYGDYFDGLAPDCNIPDDDYAHQLGDPNEALLNEALYYIDNGHC